jgi:hypothetical protein
METLSQCKPSILPSLRRKHQPSQVLAVMHLLLCPLQQERASSISLKTHCLNNSVSNTDTGSIKQASNQTKSMSNPPKQCSVPSAEDPKKETFPTDCGNPLEQSSTQDPPNTRPLQLAARDGQRLRQASDLSDQNHEPATASGFWPTASHTRRVFTLHTSSGKRKRCIRNDWSPAARCLHTSRWQRGAQQMPVKSVSGFTERSRQSGAPAKEHCTASIVGRAIVCRAAAQKRFVRIVFQPCESRQYGQIGSSLQVGVCKLVKFCSRCSFIYYNCQHECEKAAICFPGIHGPPRV